MITSAPFEDPERGWEVLVFPVPLSAPGVTVRNDWDTLGMRATGSNSIELADVFVADDAITLRRPRGQWHPSWSVTVHRRRSGLHGAVHRHRGARGRAGARDGCGRKPDPVLISSLGELGNALTVARWRSAR
jgi:acyl-CoA dehydrogenase